jgi:hypothetical protein
MTEPFIAHSEISNEIYIICGKNKYPVTEQVISAMKATGRLEERPHGEWLSMEVSSGRDSWKCSVCGRRARGKLTNLPFCHCGAKMKGGAK